MTPFVHQIPNDNRPWNRSKCRWHDTIATARFRAPDLPKGLGVIGTLLTDVHQWKNDHDGNKIATKGQDDDERLDYCHLDVAVNVEIESKLKQIAITRGAFRQLREGLKPTYWPSDRNFNLYEVDILRQELCTEAHRMGILVDQNLRSRMEVLLTQEVKLHYDALQQLANLEGLRNFDIASAASEEDDRDEDETYDEKIAGSDNAEAVDGIKPGSSDAIRELLYEKWQLECPPNLSPKDYLTASGLPSTGDIVLRAHLANPRLKPYQEKFIRELRQYRRKRNKGLGTVLIPLRLRSVDSKRGLVWPDGRVRSSLGCLLTSVGRWNSRHPNLQNLGNKKGAGVWFDPKELRYRFGTPNDEEIQRLKYIIKSKSSRESEIDEAEEILLNTRADYQDPDKHKPRKSDGRILVGFKDLFISEPGNWLYGFDLDAIHMVVVANEWNIPVVEAAYRDGLDLHNVMALTLKPDEFPVADGWPNNTFDLKAKPKGLAKALREMAKVFRYTSIYGGDPLTKLKVMQSFETDSGELPYVKYDKDDMILFDKRWKAAEPEWQATWERICNEYVENGGWVESYILNRRSGDLEAGKLNAVVNYPILSTEQDVMALIEIEVAGALNFEYYGRYLGGFNLQIHDYLQQENPRKHKRMILDTMSQCVKRVGERIQNTCGWKFPPTAVPGFGPTMRYC